MIMIRITIVIISALLRVYFLTMHLTTSGLRPWCNTKLLQHSYLGSCILFLVIVLFFLLSLLSLGFPCVVFFFLAALALLRKDKIL